MNVRLYILKYHKKSEIELLRLHYDKNIIDIYKYLICLILKCNQF